VTVDALVLTRVRIYWTVKEGDIHKNLTVETSWR